MLREPRATECNAEYESEGATTAVCSYAAERERVCVGYSSCYLGKNGYLKCSRPVILTNGRLLPKAPWVPQIHLETKYGHREHDKKSTRARFGGPPRRPLSGPARDLPGTPRPRTSGRLRLKRG